MLDKRHYVAGVDEAPIPDVSATLGDRLRRYRVQQDIAQAVLARRAGISERTLRSLEQGHDVQLSTLLRVLRALGRLDALDAFLPPPQTSPMELLSNRMKERKRASRRPRGDERR